MQNTTILTQDMNQSTNVSKNASVAQDETRRASAASDLSENKFTPDLLSQTGYREKYYQLLQLEPGINWLGFGAKVYKKNHRIASVTKRIEGSWAFREFLRENADKMQLDKEKPLIETVFKRVKKAKDGAKYRVFDDFSTYCDSVKGYKPNTTWGYVASAKALAKYCDTGITNDGFKDHVTMPTATALDEEYPPNDVIMRILDASPPHLRTFLLYLADTGAEPIDAIRLHKDMIFFDETPTRIQFKRKKTSKPITQFINDFTANALKSQLAKNGENGFVFVTELKARSCGKFYRLYARKLEEIGLNEKLDDSKTSKYHFKIFKKRWFTMAISAGIPEYVAQGMLGRKKYLDQYMALPLDQKREFAKKILRKTSVYASKEDEAEKRRALAEALGLPDLSAEQMSIIRGVFMRVLEQPKSKIFDEI